MGLTTFFQDADKGKSKFEELRKLSNETTFGVDELTDSFTQLANVGVKVDTITGKLTMLGDLAQGDKAKFAELTSIYAKIQSTGKAGALQLQQIASRGIPIYDVLKKIGVQGTATAEDITKAFEKMTEEGGQFYNAMNNINETIEGKRGFISDYLKEMSVNFVEVTGLADAYKAVLDNLKDVIGAVSDKLLEWNENPVMKALISGLFVASLTAIGGVIATAIIPKLVAVIENLVTINLLSGPKGWAVLAVAGITGAVVAMNSFSKSSEDAVKEQEKLADAIEKTKKAGLLDDAKKSVGLSGSDTRTARLQNETSYLQGLKDGLEEVKKKLEEADTLKKELITDSAGDMKWLERNEEYQEVVQQIKDFNEQIERSNKLIKDQESVVTTLQNEVNNVKSLGDLSQQFEEIYNGTLTKEVKEMTDLTSQLQQVRDYEAKLKELQAWKDNEGNLIKYDDKTKEQIDQTVQYLQTKLNEVELNLKLANLESWQKKLQSAFGFTNKEVMGGAVDSTVGALAKFQEMWKSQGALYSKYGIEGSKYDSKEEYAKAIRSAFDAVLESVREGAYSGDEASLVSFASAVKDAEDAVKGLTKESWSLSKALEHQQGESAGTYAGKAVAGTLINASGDAGNFVQGFEQNGIIGGIIETLLGAIMNVVQEFDNFDEVMNPITNLMQEAKPALQKIFNILETASDSLEPIGEVLNTIFNVLTPIIQIITEDFNSGIEIFSSLLQAISPILNIFRILFTVARVLVIPLRLLAKGISNVLRVIGRWFGGISESADALEEYVNEMYEGINAKKKETEEIKKATDGLNALYSAMKEQEEYYLKQKSLLISDTYKQNAVKKVNDMILTDKGVFSTSPKDTIMAMKKPESLLGGKTEVNVQVVDNVGVNANVRQEGNNILIELISQKIANDYADGSNGWASAIAVQQQSSTGLSISR